MTSALSNVLNQLEQLSFDELLMVQEQVNRQIRTKPAVSTSQTTAPASRRGRLNRGEPSRPARYDVKFLKELCR